MKKRAVDRSAGTWGGVFAVALFAVIILQFITMVQSDKIYRALNELDNVLGESAVFGQFDNFSGVENSQDANEGDWLVWAFRVEPKTLNQISVERDIYSKWMTVPYIFEPLLMYDFNDLTMRPWLAESYEISDDGLEIIYHLRDDIFFSDGEPITADDVIFTYETIINPKIDAADLANLFNNVERAEKIDERTVRFVLKWAYFKSLENTSLWDIGVYPKHIYQYADERQFNMNISNPLGSGPYVFEKWESGNEIVLRRNENYWGERPKLDKSVFKFITNAVAAVQAIKSHKVDMIIPEPDQFAELAADEKFNEEFRCLSYWNPGAPFYYMGWNCDTPFFSDKKVRLAMTHIVDREQMMDKLLKGYGQIITGPYFIKGEQNDASIEPWPYDPKRAAELLDEAGWVDTDGDGVRDKDGTAFRFKFLYSNDSVFYQRLAKLFKDEAAKVGIEVIPDPYEWSVVIGKITDRDFESMVMGWGGDILEDDYQLFHSSQIGNRGSNYVGYRSAEMDELLERIRRTMDVGHRNELCHRVHRILHDEQPYTFLYARPTFRAIDRRFENVKVYKLGLKYWEWYVPKDRQRY
ncbi:MAG: peptide-binding protein [Phycisphaerae bacterium]|jgi:peptide/nickel transport system substrate-binding protein